MLKQNKISINIDAAHQSSAKHVWRKTNKFYFRPNWHFYKTI